MVTGPVRSRRGALDRWLDRLELPEGESSAVVGCSGGADSLALVALAVAAGLDPLAVHVDHRLRAGSGDEAQMVADQVRRLGVESFSVAVDVAPGANLEARAREARLAALEDVRSSRGLDVVLLGHTLDDQAETVLLNLLRGAASAGLAGMPAARDHIAHPLLRLSHSDTVEICARVGCSPLVDPMNTEPRFRRVWLRREAIPFLEAGAGRDLRRVLARQARVLREESDFLDRCARDLLAALAGDEGGSGADTATLDARALARAEPALARRVVRAWLGAPPPSLDEVDSVLDVAAGQREAVMLSQAVRVERSGGRLRRVPTGGDGHPAVVPFEVPVPGWAGSGALSIETWIERAAPACWPDGRSTCVLDADVVGERLAVRPPLPDEQFMPLGMSRPKAVRKLLAEAGVAPAARGACAVLATSAGEPAWLVGYRVGAHARVTARTRRYLWATAHSTEPS